MPQQTPFSILYVDDEDKALKYFRRAFAKDFSILTAESVAEALEVLAEKGEEIGVLVTDQRMPEQTGLDLLKQVRKGHPHIVRILTTAYSELNDAIEAVNSGEIFRYTTKPWDIDALHIELNLAMRFFLLQRERDILIQEKLSVGQRMIAMDRVRNLIGLCASFNPYIRYSLQGADAFLADMATMMENYPMDVSAEENVDLWSLPADETQRLITLAQHLAENIQHISKDFTDELLLTPWLDEAEQANTHKNIKVQKKIAETLPRTKVNAHLAKRLLNILFTQAVNLSQDDGDVTITTEAIDTVWQTPGLRILFSIEPINLETTASLVSDSFDQEMSTLSEQNDLLSAYLLSYHHGGKLQVAKEGDSGVQFICELPHDPLTSVPPQLSDDWLEDVFVRFEA